MQIIPSVSYMRKADVEASAYALLSRYGAEFEPVVELPVPVEKIADFLLELSLDWGPIADEAASPVLAYIDPGAGKIRINEHRRSEFELYPGMLEFTLGHEVGHHQLHMLGSGVEQLAMDFGSDIAQNPKGPTDAEIAARSGLNPKGYLCRERLGGSVKDTRETQANWFASYLLMPEHLLRPSIKNVNLLSWPNLYRLSERCCVSISALKIRLAELRLVYVGADGALYRTEAEANGLKRLL